MRYIRVFLFSVLCLVSVSLLNADTFIPPDDPAIRYIGRFDMSDPKAPQYTWPGVYFKFRMTGTAFSLVFEDPHNIYKVIVDGKAVREIRPGKGKSTNAAVKDLAPGTEHDIIVYKRTEETGITGRFHGILMHGGAAILPGEVSGRMIEFIGDSFTAGYGNIADSKSCPGDGVWLNTDVYKAYGPITARRFGAECMVNAWSGRGLVLNYGKSLPADRERAMPAEYLKTLQNDEESRWDFREPHPDLVVIFLGLNDFSTPHDDKCTQPDDPKVSQYQREYKKLVEMMRGQYPGVKILCVAYPTLGIDSYVKEFVEAQKKKGYGDIDHCTMPLAGGELGCDWHPNVRAHRKMAEALIPQVAEYMGWEE